MKQKITLTLLFCYMLLISFLSLSKPDAVADISEWDKFAHALAYLGFSALCANVSINRQQYCKWIFICLCYGILIEFLQGMTAYREASLYDALANASGLVAGTAILCIIHLFTPIKALQSRHH